MSNNQVCKALKIENIDLADVVVGEKNGKKIPITINGEQLIFQSSFLCVKSKLRKTDKPNISQMDTNFTGLNQKKVNQFYDFIEKFEDYVLRRVKIQAEYWPNFSNLNVKSLIRGCGDEENTIRWIFLDTKTKFVDENRNDYDPQDINENDFIKLIVEIPYLWVDDNGNGGFVIIVHKVLVKKAVPEEIPTEYVFDDSDDDSDDNSNEENIISMLQTENNRDAVPRRIISLNKKQPSSEHFSSSDNEFTSKDNNIFMNDDALELDDDF